MSGTPEGNKKSAEAKLKSDPDYFKKLGARGNEGYLKKKALGINKPRGFATMSPEQRKEVGRKGGIISRKKK